MMMVHRDDHSRPFPSSGGEDGPTSYDVVGAAAAAAPAGSSGEVLRGSQPFDISNRTNTSAAAAAAAAAASAASAAAAAAHHHITAFRSPDTGGMTTFAGFPFTNTQWKELERQAMIYKYMVASLPVPRDLLFPITRAPSGSAVSQSPLGNGFNLRLSNSRDPEPGRCKRTDGKKWRCSRDVAPEQKYCERHLHRGRPRSRKHVEGHANNTTTTTAAATTTKRARHDINQPPPPLPPPTAVPVFTPTTRIDKNVCPTQFVGSTVQAYHESPATFDSSVRDPRNLEWGTKATSVQISDPQWHQLSSKIPFFDANASGYTQRSEEDCFLNLNSYTNFNAGDDQHDGDCNLFLNPDVVPLENPLLEETPRCFIDAWSKTMVDDGNNRNNSSSTPSSRQLSPSSLTLSMGGYTSINEGMAQTEMSLGSNDDGVKPRHSTWLTPASSWSASAPGGPLAEVLKPATSSASNPPSPITTGNTNGDLGSPLATTTVSSSPSGVLQKTFVSLSDSSGNSSPTLASSRAKHEIGYMWLNQNKA